jgi:hypothetical protein
MGGKTPAQEAIMQVIHKVREIVGRRHALAIATAGSVILAVMAGLGIAFGGVLWRVGLGGLAVMFLADVVWLVQEWLDEWRYQRLVDDYEEAVRTGRPQLLDLDVDLAPGTPSSAIAAGRCPSCLGAGEVDRAVPVAGRYPCSTCAGTGLWPPACDDDDVDVSDTQTGQGVE